MLFVNALFIIKHINLANILSKVWQKLDFAVFTLLCQFAKSKNMWQVEIQGNKEDMLVRIAFFGFPAPSL